MNKSLVVSRRNALNLAAASSVLPLVHIRSAHAAGSLKLAFWDHWVPAANPVMQKLVAQWGTQNKVDVTLDLLSSGAANSKLPLTQAAEALSGTGHGVMAFNTWDVQHYAQHLTPIDDVMSVQIKQYGAIDQTAEYLAKVKGHWMAMPTSVGSQYKPSCAASAFSNKRATTSKPGTRTSKVTPRVPRHGPTTCWQSWHPEQRRPISLLGSASAKPPIQSTGPRSAACSWRRIGGRKGQQPAALGPCQAGA